jgi:protein TonB
MDPKAIEDEVQRQIAARRKEIQKALDAKAATAAAAPLAGRKTEEAAVPAVPSPAPAPPKESVPEPAPVPTEPPPVREAAPEPTPVVRAPQREEVVRGDLVGPGAGVSEPELISTPHVTYPPIARQQRLTGKVVVLVLVNEDGQVGEARLQQGLASRSGVNEAVVQAVRTSRFKPATKNGVPVKMWRTVVVEVKP